jgi:RNA polymerase sigma-70 factor, ECF subfamily
MTTPDPIRLLCQIADGDEEALRLLYVEYQLRLRRYLWRLLDGDGHAVEEALQDTFLAVWRGASGYRGEAKVATWLFQIAHHVAYHARQTAARREWIEVEKFERMPADGAIAPVATSPENAVLERLTLDEALQRLSTKHRAVLHLVFEQGFTAEEVALILRVPLGTVKSRVSYARRALQSALGRTASEGGHHDA